MRTPRMPKMPKAPKPKAPKFTTGGMVAGHIWHSTKTGTTRFISTYTKRKKSGF